MDYIGCRWTVWAGHGNIPGLAGKGVSRPEDCCIRLNDRASALAGSVGALIETCQPESQPVAGRPANRSRLKDRFDVVRTAVSRALAPLSADSKLEAGFLNLHPPPQRRGGSPSERKALCVAGSPPC